LAYLIRPSAIQTTLTILFLTVKVFSHFDGNIVTFRYIVLKYKEDLGKEIVTA